MTVTAAPVLPGPAENALPGALSAISGPVAWTDQQYILLTSPDDWLVVESGNLDVFLVTPGPEGPQGPWQPLCRLSRGDVVTGPMAGPRHRMLCRRVEGAEAHLVRLRDLRSLVPGATGTEGPGGALVAAFCAGIEAGVRRTSSVPRDGLPPREFTALSSGVELDLAPGEVTRAVDGILWVTVLAGEVREGGESGGVHCVGDQLCLTRQDWLTARSDARIGTANTVQVVLDGSVWSRLVIHCTRLLYGLDRAVERGERVALEQIGRASERDSLVLDQLRNDYDVFIRSYQASSRAPSETAARGHLAAVLTVLDSTGATYQPPRPELAGIYGADYDAIGASEWVRTRPLRLEGVWWRGDIGAIVGHWGVDHLPVAFLPSEGGYLACGRGLDTPVRVTRANTHLAGRQAWAVYPMLPRSVTSVWALLRYGFGGLRGEVSLFVVMAMLVGALSLLTPILNGRILGSFVESANRPMIVQGGLIVIMSGLVAAALSVVQNLAVLRIQGSVTARTQTAVWSRLLQLPVTFFQRYSTGRLGTIVLGVKAAQEALSGVVVTAALGLVVAVANLLLIFFYSVTLALLGLGLTLVAVLVCFASGRTALRFERERYFQEQKLSAITYETLSAITKIRGTAGEERALLRWAGQQRRVQALVMRSRQAQDAVVVFNAVYPLVSMALLYVVANRLSQNELTLPQLISFMTAFTLMLTAVLQFTAAALTAVPIIPMLEGLAPVLAAEPESGVSKAHPGDLAGQVSMRQINFRYGDDGPIVLDGIDLEIGQGEFVAIVGPSGSGKSTIIRLLLGFDRPRAGSILFDGQDLGELDVSAVRRQCGVVLQSGSLMAGDIRDNIAVGGRYRDDEIWDAAEMAGLAADIRAMPMGLHTVVDETAQGLSGGQVQRLMVARALVSRPRIVLFDEATSALDNPTQQVVAEATRQLNATRIVVAHRLSTVQSADRIIVMDRGRIVQQGTYEQLLSQPEGLFATLARGQRV